MWFTAKIPDALGKGFFGEVEKVVPIITLLTDFGIQDSYVASMKGVILSICPEARMVDITHMIAPQEVRAGAFVLGTVYRDFPLGTIHLAVVDPGVGTERRALAIEAGGYFFVGPDNGLFSWVLSAEPAWKARSLENPDYWRPCLNPIFFGQRRVSATFHGRDLFAPVAAHLAWGVDLDALGPPCTPTVASWSAPVPRGDALQGEVIYVDRFGNAVTNLTAQHLETFAPQGKWQRIVEVKGERGQSRVKPVETYGQGDPGESLALIGSSNHLEVAVNQGNAAKSFGLRPGSRVCVYRYISADSA